MGNQIKGMQGAIDQVNEEQSKYSKTEKEEYILSRASGISEMEGPKGEYGRSVYEYCAKSLRQLHGGSEESAKV